MAGYPRSGSSRNRESTNWVGRCWNLVGKKRIRILLNVVLALQCEEAVPRPRSSSRDDQQMHSMIIRRITSREPWRKSSRFADGKEGGVETSQCNAVGNLWRPRISDPFAELLCWFFASCASWLELSFEVGVPCPSMWTMGASIAHRMVR